MVTELSFSSQTQNKQITLKKTKMRVLGTSSLLSDRVVFKKYQNWSCIYQDTKERLDSWLKVIYIHSPNK